jgi:hypothetical protein
MLNTSIDMVSARLRRVAAHIVAPAAPTASTHTQLPKLHGRETGYKHKAPLPEGTGLGVQGQLSWEEYVAGASQRAAALGNRGPLARDAAGRPTDAALKAMVEGYRANGFCVIKGLVSREEVRATI